MKWYLRSCPACGGDLHDDLYDAGWVTCFMCARSFDWREPHPEVVIDEPAPEPTCRNGHPINEENTYTLVGVNGKVYHRCRICTKKNQQANRDRLREKRNSMEKLRATMRGEVAG